MWNFTSIEEDLISIENINKTKVWGTTNGSKVILENFEDISDEQRWKKGEPNSEGYFTLGNHNVSKFLTAASSTIIELKGNITLSTLSFYNNEPSKNKHFLILLSSLARNSQEPKLKRIFEIP